MADVNLLVEVKEAGIAQAIKDIATLKSQSRSAAAGFTGLSSAVQQAFNGIQSKMTGPTTSFTNFDKVLSTTGKSATQLKVQLSSLDAEYSKIARLNPLATAQGRITAAGAGNLAAGLAAGATVAQGREAFNADIVRDYNTVMAQTAQLEQARTGRLTAQTSLNDALWERGLVGMNAVQRAEVELTRAEQQYAEAIKVSASARGALSNVSKLDIEGQIAKQEQYNAAIQQQATALREVTSAQQTLKSAAASANDTGNAFQSSFSYFIIAGEAKALASAITDIGAASLSASGAVQSEFADVDRTFGGTKQQLADLKTQLFALSTSTPNDFAALSQIATLGNQLGVGADDIQSFTTAISQYATVSGQSAQDASTAFGKISELTGLAASKYTNLAAAIEYVARTSVSTEAGIQRTAQEITAIAAGAGFSADAIVGLSGALASLSIPPERARGALSLYFGALNSAVAAGGPKLAEFATLTGLTTQKIQQLVETNKGQDVFTAFIKGLSNLNSVAKTTALADLGLKTIRVDQTMRALSQNTDLVTKSLNDANNAFTKGTEVGRQYAIKQATLASVWKEFQDAVANAAAGIGDVFNAGPLNGVLGAVKNLLVAFQDFAHSPAGPYILGVVGAVAALVAIVAAAVGGFLLFTATMKLVPWALSGLGAKEASKGIVQFVAGMFKLNLVVDEVSNTVSVNTDAIARNRLGLAVHTQAAAADADAMTLQARAALGLGEAMTLAAGETEGLAIATRGAAAGMNTLKFAEIGTGILAAAVIVGTLIQAFTEAGNSAESASKKAQDFFGGSTSTLSSALAKDQLTYVKTGEALTQIGVKTITAKTTTDGWVKTLENAGGQQVELNKSMVTTTKSIENQTVAFGINTQKALAAQLESKKSIQDLFKGSASNLKLSQLGFDPTDFLKALVGSPEGGKQYVDNFTNGLAKELHISGDKLKQALDDAAGGTLNNHAAIKLGIPISDVDTINLIAKGYQNFASAADDVQVGLKGAAQKTAEQASVQAALNQLSTGTSTGFQGATESLTEFQSAISSGLGKFVDFSTVLTAVQGKLKSPLGVNATAFNKGLASANQNAVNFYNGINKLAQAGNSSFATQLASIGPDAQGVLTSALKLSPAGQQTLEENARFAAFLASDAFKTALKGDMANSNVAYAEIFNTTGDLGQVQSLIKAQVEGTATQFEQQWDIAHPTLPLNIDIQDPTTAQLQQFKQQNDGRLTVTADVIPVYRGDHPTAVNVNTFKDTKTGGSISLPANLDGKALSASLAYWKKNEGKNSTEIQAALNTKNFDSDITDWTAKHGKIKVLAEIQLKSTGSSVEHDSVNVPAKLQTKNFSSEIKSWEKSGYTPAQIAARLKTEGFDPELQAWAAKQKSLVIPVTIKPKASGFTFTATPVNVKATGGEITMPHFASGGSWGQFTGPGSGTSDSLLARVSAGEFISTTAATSFWGTDFMDSLNRKMLPASFARMLGAAAVSGNSGPSHVAYVTMSQHNPVTRDPLKQLASDSANIAAGIWGSE